jgi:hypothetical protein
MGALDSSNPLPGSAPEFTTTHFESLGDRAAISTASAPPPALKRELALTLFAQGKLSFGKARELAALMSN